jgi:hypothetical protein
MSSADVDAADAARQRALLADCAKRVQEQSFFMKRAIDQCNLSATVDRAADLLRGSMNNIFLQDLLTFPP